MHLRLPHDLGHVDVVLQLHQLVHLLYLARLRLFITVCFFVLGNLCNDLLRRPVEDLVADSFVRFKDFVPHVLMAFGLRMDKFDHFGTFSVDVGLVCIGVFGDEAGVLELSDVDAGGAGELVEVLGELAEVVGEVCTLV